MKKSYLISVLLALTTWVSAQTFMSEDFSSGIMPPTGWTIDAHSANWSNEASANAGGLAPEAMMNWDPQFNGYSRLISPMIDLTGLTSVSLMFKHFVDDYDGSAGYSVGAATRSAGGAWNIVWTVSPTGNVGPEEQIIQINNSDVGSSEFQFCVFFNGTSYNLDYWYVDDIVLFQPYNLDAAINRVNTPLYFSDNAPVNGVIKNMGNDVITSVDVAWTVDNINFFSTSFTGLNLAFSDSYEFLCNDVIHYPIGTYNLRTYITAVNNIQDDNPGNDTLNKTVSVISHVVDRKPAFEEFTSSTCGPCAQFNTSFNPWCSSYAEDITLVKYQMNWPGNGDPYYTEEGGVRRNYYGVSYVPWPQCNGAYVDYNISAVQAAYDNAILQPGLAEIAATHHLEGTTMTVTANVLPFAAFNDFRVHIIVFENTTTGNVSSNGETEFHHVMMKMMPDANGTTVNLNDREPYSVTLTQDLAGTFIEEYTDLGVAVYFQDNTSKEIFQSVYSEPDYTFATEARCSDIEYDGTTLPGFSPDVFDYWVELPEGTTEVPVVTAIAMEPYATVVVVPAWSLPGTTVVDCFAENLMTHVRYNITFDIAEGVNDPANPNSLVRVFPNPAKDELFIRGAENADIRIFSLTGQQVLAVNGFKAQSIDVSKFTNGIYTVQAILEDNTVVTNKITIVR
jgi:hypothetical protein